MASNNRVVPSSVKKLRNGSVSPSSAGTSYSQYSPSTASLPSPSPPRSPMSSTTSRGTKPRCVHPTSSTCSSLTLSSSTTFASSSAPPWGRRCRGSGSNKRLRTYPSFSTTRQFVFGNSPTIFSSNPKCYSPFSQSPLRIPADSLRNRFEARAAKRGGVARSAGLLPHDKKSTQLYNSVNESTKNQVGSDGFSLSAHSLSSGENPPRQPSHVSIYPLEEVRCQDAVFDVCFHPCRPGLLAAGLVSGVVEIHQLPSAEEMHSFLATCRQRRREERLRARQQRREEKKRRLIPKEKTLCVSAAEDSASTPTFQHKEFVCRCASAANAEEKDVGDAGEKSEKNTGRQDGNSHQMNLAEGNTDAKETGMDLNKCNSDCCRSGEALQEADTRERQKAEESFEDSSSSSEEEDEEALNHKYLKKDLKTYETQISSLLNHRSGCRVVRFSLDGKRLFSSSSDKRLLVSDFEAAGAPSSWRSKRQEEAINALCVLTNNIVAAGDDGGSISVWDIRQTPSASPVARFSDHEDFISDMVAATVSESGGNAFRDSAPLSASYSPSSSSASLCFSTSVSSLTSSCLPLASENEQYPSHLLATGGDMLGVFDLRKKQLFARSDGLEEDIHCVQVVKSGSKVVCGCQDGSLSIFSWGDFGDLNDRLTGHKQSVEAMVKLTEDVLLTGSSDGSIRIVQVFPNEILGVLGQHTDGLATVEKLAISQDKTLLASCAYDETISLFQVDIATRFLGTRKRPSKKLRAPPRADLRKGRDFFDDL